MSDLRRILIIGCAGAGKSTLARQLGAILKLEVIHLDAIYWNPGWVETPKAQWENTVGELLNRDAWIMDGNYAGTLEARLTHADAVIFLDFPRHVCLRRVIARWWQYWGKTRPDLAHDCPEKIDWEFVQWIWDYPAATRPLVLEKLTRLFAGKPVYILRSQNDINRFVQAIADQRLEPTADVAQRTLVPSF